jgi:hypothetical protein
MAIVGSLAVLGALFLACVPSRRVFAVWDGAARTFRARGRLVPFADIARVAVVTSASGFPTLCVETTRAGTMPIWFATGAQAAAIDALATRLNGALAPGVFAPAGALRDAAPSSPAAIEQSFRTVVILAIGVLWTGAGYFFFRGLSFASRHDPDGLQIPVWSAGLLILALGVYEWIKSRRR